MRRSATPYLFLLPYLAIFALFWAWPIIESLLLSFQNTRVYPPVWDINVNWGRILGDAAFWDALRNTILILVIQVPLMLALATALAIALNSQLLRAKGFFASLFSLR